MYARIASDRGIGANTRTLIARKAALGGAPGFLYLLKWLRRLWEDGTVRFTIFNSRSGVQNDHDHELLALLQRDEVRGIGL